VTPRRRRLTTAIVAGAAAAVLATGATGAAGAAAPILAATVRHAKPAVRPFRSWTQTSVRVGHENLRVVVADDDDERVQGLRERADIGPYGGMLFVFPVDTESSFTMSTVKTALDIGFYDERGRVVDRLRMEPCAGDESDCPVYEPDGPFTYALETLAGDLPKGRIRPAPSTSA
jgi:uncharacterized membrane protein (UPF0127 family)